MAQYEGITIAFSHKGGFWKSRYSYTPTCYASIDNVMISNNNSSTIGDDNFFWEHSSIATRNSFYGTSYPSQITIVSNQDPSAVKIFKSLSIESNSNNWVGTAKTNINPIGAPQNELQSGDIKGFVTKEGNQYSELPRSLTNSSSHIDFICILSEIAAVDEDSYPVQAALGNPAGTAWDVEIETIPNVSVLSGAGGVALFISNDNKLKYISTNTPTFQVLPFTDYREAMSNSPVYVYSYNANQGTITFAYNTNGTTSPSDASTLHNLVASAGLTPRLYIATSPEINGDPMRGNYLYLTLTNTSTTPVETYAVNVDFENTKLDGSKGAANRAAPAQKASRGSK
jgi:hypothetical protein